MRARTGRHSVAMASDRAAPDWPSAPVRHALAALAPRLLLRLPPHQFHLVLGSPSPDHISPVLSPEARASAASEFRSRPLLAAAAHQQSGSSPRAHVSSSPGRRARIIRGPAVRRPPEHLTIRPRGHAGHRQPHRRPLLAEGGRGARTLAAGPRAAQQQRVRAVSPQAVAGMDATGGTLPNFWMCATA